MWVDRCCPLVTHHFQHCGRAQLSKMAASERKRGNIKIARGCSEEMHYTVRNDIEKQWSVPIKGRHHPTAVVISAKSNANGSWGNFWRWVVVRISKSAKLRRVPSSDVSVEPGHRQSVDVSRPVKLTDWAGRWASEWLSTEMPARMMSSRLPPEQWLQQQQHCHKRKLDGLRDDALDGKFFCRFSRRETMDQEIRRFKETKSEMAVDVSSVEKVINQNSSSSLIRQRTQEDTSDSLSACSIPDNASRWLILA